MITLHPYTEHDHGTLSAWWGLQNWAIIPHDHLPKNGVVARSENGALAAGFLYLTDSKISWLEFIVGNPLCDKIERGKALDFIIKHLLEIAKKNDKTTVFSSSNHQGLMKRYELSGATKTDTDVSHFIWSL